MDFDHGERLRLTLLHSSGDICIACRECEENWNNRELRVYFWYFSETIAKSEELRVYFWYFLRNNCEFSELGGTRSSSTAVAGGVLAVNGNG